MKTDVPVFLCLLASISLQDKEAEAAEVHRYGGSLTIAKVNDQAVSIGTGKLVISAMMDGGEIELVIHSSP
jgi:hypothetical protein